MGDLDEAPDLIASREDFESMMDEFLEKYEVISGKMRPVLPGTATEKLDTIRKALGEAKIRDDAEESESDDDDILMPLDIDDKKDRWDCETILSKSYLMDCLSTSEALSQLHIATWRTTQGLLEPAATSPSQRFV